VVVLLLEGSRAHGHSVDGATQEGEPDLIPARLPPRHHVEHLVVGHDLHTRWTVYVSILLHCAYGGAA